MTIIIPEERQLMEVVAKGAAQGILHYKDAGDGDFCITNPDRSFFAMTCGRNNAEFIVQFQPYNILRLLSALDTAEAIASKTEMPCPHCDFSSGYRGMDSCGKCNGTGRISVIASLEKERDRYKRSAEKTEAERNELLRAISHHKRIAESLTTENNSLRREMRLITDKLQCRLEDAAEEAYESALDSAALDEIRSQYRGEE